AAAEEGKGHADHRRRHGARPHRRRPLARGRRGMNKSLTAIAAASVLLSACASAGSVPRASIPPAATGGFVGADSPAVTSAAAPAADWWRLFDDPALDALVAEALAANKDLEIAAANLARVRAS